MSEVLSVTGAPAALQVWPEFVVWNPLARDFDGVPNVVRVPIIFDAVIADYEPFESAAEFEILRRRPAGAPVRVDYWRSKLGTTIDLRALPARSGLRSSAVCGESQADCVDALEVRLTNSSEAGSLGLPVRVGSEAFEVKLSTVEGVTRYLIDLRRLWFWGSLKRLGYDPEAGAAPPGVQAKLVRLARNPGLY